MSIRTKKGQLLGSISKNNYFTFNSTQIYLSGRGGGVIYEEKKGTFYILGVYIDGNTACWITTKNFSNSVNG